MRELAVLQILERRVREQEMFEASRRVDEIRSFALGDIAFDITDCLAIETGLLLGEQVCLLVQIHQPFVSSLFEKGVCERERFLTESLYHFGFVSSRICLEKYCTLHDSNRQDLAVSCLRNCRQFLPPINGVGFLVGS